MPIKSNFTKNVLTLLTGTSIAQAIPIIVSPLLTRLYSPEEFGILALFITFNTTCSIVATGKYDLALMLPVKDEDAVNVMGLSISFIFIVSLLIGALVIFFNDIIVSMVNAPQFADWLYLLPLSVALFGVYQVLCSWMNRQRKYLVLASSDVFLKVASESIKLGIGALRKSEIIFINGLVAGYFAGIVSAFSILVWQFAKTEWRMLRFIQPQRFLQLGGTYKKFPIYNVPYSFMGSVSQGSMIIALSFFGHLGAAGLFGFVKSAMFLPISLLSTSLGRVYFKEASVHFGTPRLEQIIFKLMSGIVDICTPAFIFFIFWAPEIFNIIFGKAWIEAGRFAAIFAPAAFLFLFTSWPERTFEVAQKQQISFGIQLVWDSIIIITISTALYNGVQPVTSVGIYTILLSLYHITYLYAVFKIAKLDYHIIVILLKKVVIISAVLAPILILAKTSLPSEFMRWTLSLFAMLAVYAVLFYQWIRSGKLFAVTPKK